MRSFALLLIPVSSLTFACGGDDGSSTPLDAPIDTPTAVCTVSTNSFGEKGALTGTSTFRAGATAGIGDISAVLPLEAAPPADILIVEFYTGFAPFGTSAAPTAVVPGTYQLSGSQLQYADCGICVRIGTNATTQDFEDDYMATGGTVVVTQAGTAVGGALMFSLTNLTFEHVTIAEQTFVSTPVGDGCATAISSATFNGKMTAPPNKPGAAGTATTVRLTRKR